MKNIDTIYYPLTDIQTGLLLARLGTSDKKSADEGNVIRFRFEITGNHNNEALETAYNAVLKNNDSLRLKIERHGFGFRQYIKPFHKQKLEVRNFKSREDYLAYYPSTNEDHPIFCTSEELIWAEIDDYQSGTFLTIRASHLCLDGFSISLFLKQLQQYYIAYENKNPEPNLKTGSITDFFEEHKRYLSSEQFKEDKKYLWKQFNSRPDYRLPARRRAFDGTAGEINCIIKEEHYEKVTSFCMQEKIPLSFFIGCITAITVAKLRKCFHFQITFMSHGRNTFLLKNTIGCMMTSVPVFFDFDLNDTIGSFLPKQYASYLEALSHGQLPMNYQFVPTYFQSVKCGFEFSHNWMLFSPMDFVFSLSAPRFHAEVIPYEKITNQFYNAVFDNHQNELRINLHFQKKVFTEEEIRKAEQEFLKIIDKVITSPDCSLSDIFKKNEE